METGYQRSKIQEESMYYEMLKHTGDYPIVGVNTFRDPHADGADMIEGASCIDWPEPPPRRRNPSSTG
jgi:methylmalonyl-CoA mutase